MTLFFNLLPWSMTICGDATSVRAIRCCAAVGPESQERQSGLAAAPLRGRRVELRTFYTWDEAGLLHNKLRGRPQTAGALHQRQPLVSTILSDVPLETGATSKATEGYFRARLFGSVDE